MARRSREQILSDYYKERRSILNRRRYISKKYGIDLTEVTLPKIPEKITAKSISELSKTRTRVEKTAVAKSVVKGVASKSAEKFLPSYSDVAISRFKELATTFIFRSASKTLLSWLEELIQKFGRAKVGEVLSKAERDGIVPNKDVFYSDTTAENYMHEVMEYFWEEDLISHDDIDEMIENSQYFSETEALDFNISDTW